MRLSKSLPKQQYLEQLQLLMYILYDNFTTSGKIQFSTASTEVAR